MPIARMDHFTILTTNAEKTVAFYSDILGFASGPRPAFAFPGARFSSPTPSSTLPKARCEGSAG